MSVALAMPISFEKLSKPNDFLNSLNAAFSISATPVIPFPD
jgi:hypothetical protein